MRIRSLRENAALTQAELAAHLHISQNTYSQYESGKRQIPLSVLISLSEYYKVSVDYILCLTDEKKPYPRNS